MATATGLYDHTRREYDTPMIRASGIDLKRLLPICDDALHAIPAVRPALPSALRDAAWYPAIGDGAASNLGAGATGPGTAALNVGTSAALRIVRKGPRPQAPYGLFCYRIDRERYLVGGAVSNAGNLHAWCQRELRLPGPVDLEAALEARPLPDHGLTVLPFWLPERAPTWRDDLLGAIVGITQATTAMDLCQAVVEAGYQRLASILAMLPGRRAKLRILVGGGILHSPSSLRRLAAILGQDLEICVEPEASLRGAAVFALEKLPGHGSLTLPRGRPIHADRRQVVRYRWEHRNQARLEPLLRPPSWQRPSRR